MTNHPSQYCHLVLKADFYFSKHATLITSISDFCLEISDNVPVLHRSPYLVTDSNKQDFCSDKFTLYYTFYLYDVTLVNIFNQSLNVIMYNLKYADCKV